MKSLFFTFIKNFPGKFSLQKEVNSWLKHETPAQQFTKITLLILAGLLLGKFSALWWILVAVVFLLAGFFYKNFWLIMLGLFSVAMSWSWWTQFSQENLQNWTNQEIKITARVNGFVERKKDKKLIPMTIESVQTEHEQTASFLTGELLLIDKNNYPFEFGATYIFQGKLDPIEQTFYKYWHIRGIQYLLKSPENLQLIKKPEITISYRAWQWRQNFAEKLQNALPIPHNIIAMGMVFGVKNSLPDFVADDFRRAGLYHILVVSGFNITIILMVLAYILKGLGRFNVWILSCFILLFFILITGLEAPVLRAVLMGLVGALGVLFGRKTIPQNILLLVGVGIGIFFTHQLFLDFGFWLSFLATMGIILWTDKLEFELGKIFPGKYLPMVLSVTLAAQLAVAPLLLWWFQEISVASLLANLFVEPLVLPIILLSLALAFIPFGAMIIAFPLLVFLEIILIISQLSGWFSPLNLGLFPTIIIGTIIYSKMLRDLLVKE